MARPERVDLTLVDLEPKVMRTGAIQDFPFMDEVFHTD